MKHVISLALVMALATPAFAQESTKTPAEIITEIQQLATQLAPAPPAPSGIDYSPLLQSILKAEQQLLESQAQLLSVEKNTNSQVTQMNKTFAQTLGQVSAFLGKYVAPAVAAYLAAKKL